MDYMSKQQFREKYCADNSVKNFLISCELGKHLNNIENKGLIKSNNKVDLDKSDTQKQVKDGFVQFVDDAISVKKNEVLDVSIKDLMHMKIKLRDQDLRVKEKQDDRETFADMVKRVYTQPEKVKIYDIDAEILDD